MTIKFGRQLRGTTSRVVAVMAICAVALTGCGRSASDSTHGGTAQMTIALGASTPVFGAAYLANTLGYFKDEGLDVKLMENTGVNTANLVATGEADLAAFSVPSALVLTQQGKQTTFLAFGAGASAAASLVGAAGITSPDQLRGQRIGALGKGSIPYAAAIAYNNHFHLKAQIVVLPDNATIAGALASGQIKGATGAISNFQALLRDGKAVSLVDAGTDPQAFREAFGEDYPAGGYFALKSSVRKRPEEYAKAIRALYRATMYMVNTPAAEVATELRKSKAYQAIPVGQLAGLVTAAVPQLEHMDSTKDRWNQSLAGVGTWGVDGLTIDHDTMGYDNEVDMSFLHDAMENK